MAKSIHFDQHTKEAVMPIDNRKVPIKIDGEPYQLENRPYKATELIQLAGLDPSVVDLFRREDSESIHVPDSDEVEPRPNTRFVTKRQAAAVA
jgi:hypothetical protein